MTSSPEMDLRTRIDQALERVIRDTEGHFDECLVDRLFKCIWDYRRLNKGVEWKPNSFELYTENVQNLNYARLLRYHKLLSITHMDPEIVRSFLAHMKDIFHQAKPATTTAALSVLLRITIALRYAVDIGYATMLCTKDNRTFLLKDCGREIVGVVKRCLVEEKVYHIHDTAKKIFHNLTLAASNPASDVVELRNLIVELVRALLFEHDLKLMYLILAELFEMAFKHLAMGNREIFESLKTLVEQRFVMLAEVPESPNMAPLAQCMAYCDLTSSEVIDTLIKCNNLEAIIMYATRANYTLSDKDRPLLYYIYYPILAKCDTEDAEVLVGELIMGHDEKRFINRNLTNKHVLHCLSFLHERSQTLPSTFSHKSRVYLMKCALEYLKCNLRSPQDLKSLLVCSKIVSKTVLSASWLNANAHAYGLSEALDVLFDFLGSTNYDSFPCKSIYLEALNMLGRFLHAIKLESDLNCARNYWDRTAALALKIKTPEALCDLASYYHMVVLQGIPYLATHDKCIEVVWNHLLPIAKQSSDSELIALTVSCLIVLDFRALEETLERFGIVKKVTIPEIISEILMEYKHVGQITEQIMESMHGTSLIETKTLGVKYPNYLSWLLNDHDEYMPEVARTNSYLLVKSMCQTMRSDGLEAMEDCAFMMICDVASDLAEDPDESNLELLARMGVLELLHEVYNCSAYSSFTKTKAQDLCHDLGENLTITSDKFQEIIEPHSRAAKQLAEFFTSIRLRERPDPDPNVRYPGDLLDRQRLGLRSLLDDVLNEDRISHMAECY